MSIPAVVVAGHICLDVIPTFAPRAEALGGLLAPGRLVHVGRATTATGGAVANTGLALHRLGVPVRLVGRVGDDLFGHAVREALRAHDPALAGDLVAAPGEATSYTVVLSPPGVDRTFLHCPGVNDTFGADDVPDAALSGARLLHVGYPPLMRRLYRDGGYELAALLQRARRAGLLTTLDMALPDPGSEAGRIDWQAFLERILPHVDVFLPSLDEIRFMLGRTDTDAAGEAAPDIGQLDEMMDRLLAWGAAVVVLKLGAFGLYAGTTASAARLAAMGRGAPGDPADWRGRRVLAPGFEVDVCGTTGAGDCAVAGFLAGLVRKQSLEASLTAAAAAGACSVEHADAVSGIPSWDALQARIASGWPRRAALPGADG